MSYLIDYGALPPGAQPTGNLSDPEVIPQLVAQHIIDTCNAQRQANGLSAVTVTYEVLTDAISEVTPETQTLGACLLQVTLTDPDWTILRSGLCDIDADGLLQKVDVNYPHGTDVWWRLAMLEFGDEFSQANLTMTFQHRIINYLMNDWGPLQFSQLPGSHNTRAQFIKALADRIPRSLPSGVLGPGSAASQQVLFVCPQINELQPVASLSSAGTTVVVDSPATGSNKGTSTVAKTAPRSTVLQGPSTHTIGTPSKIFGQSVVVGTDFASKAYTRTNKLPALANATGQTAKGKPLNPTQIHVVNLLLQVGRQHNLSPLELAALIAAGIYESDLGLANGWDATNQTYGGALAGNTSNFSQYGSASSDAVTIAEANAWCEGNRGYSSPGQFVSSGDPTYIAVHVDGAVLPGGGYGANGYGQFGQQQGVNPAQVNAEAANIVAAAGGGTFAGGGSTSAASGGTSTKTASTNSGSDIGQLTRGQPNNPDEDSWTCMQRLASEVNWMIFSSPHPAPGVWGNFLYYIDGPTMVAQEPALYLELSADGTEFTGEASDGTTVTAGLVTQLTGTVDNTAFLLQQTRTVNGKPQRHTRIRTPQTPTQVKLNIVNPQGPLQFCGGDVFVFQNAGPLSGNIPNAFQLAAKQIASDTTSGGRWIVVDSTHNTLGDVFAQYTLGPPTYPYPEPSATGATVPSSGKTSKVQGPSVPSKGVPTVNGGTNPAPGATWGRLDMGFDGNYDMKQGAVAPYNGTIHGIGITGWPGDGQYFAILNDDQSGPDYTRAMYFAEGAVPIYPNGTHVTAGQKIGNPVQHGGLSTSGYSTPPGNFEIGPANTSNFDCLAKSYGLGSAGARQMILAFYAWMQSIGAGTSTDTSAAGGP